MASAADLAALVEKIERVDDRIDQAQVSLWKQLAIASVALVLSAGGVVATFMSLEERVTILEHELVHVEDEIGDLEDAEPEKKGWFR